MKKLLDIFIKKGVEKAILLIAILLFVAYFVLGFILSGRDKELDELNQESQALNTAIEAATKTETENRTSTYSAILTTWNEIPSFTDGSNWISYNPPKIIRKEKTKEEGGGLIVQKPQVLTAPKFKNITAQVGNIYLEWENTFASSDYITEVPSSYRIERRIEGEKEYKSIATVSTMTYTDINIQPKTIYHYMITSLSDKLNAEKISEEKSIKSAGVFNIAFKGIMGDKVFIKVGKFEASKQRLFDKDFFVKRGQEIGEKAQKIFVTATKAHLTIDFNTGYKAKSWGEEKVVVNDLVCKNPSDENHKPEMVQKEVKEECLIYIDDEGNEKKIWQNDKEPQGVDKRCPKHKEKKADETPKQNEAKGAQEAVKKPK